ncbi:MAG: hypothetical protein PF508_20840, partial [Spirochaeta sp.]|nr:hypothetical protein [Spirochaeta sp.]
LRQIGEYVKQHLPEWTRETGTPGVEASTAEELRREIDIRGRIVRVEEELKASRELMRQGFSAVDRRFEDMNSRVTDMQKHTNRWMTLISVFLAVIGAMPWIMGAY